MYLVLFYSCILSQEVKATALASNTNPQPEKHPLQNRWQYAVLFVVWIILGHNFQHLTDHARLQWQKTATPAMQEYDHVP